MGKVFLFGGICALIWSGFWWLAVDMFAFFDNLLIQTVAYILMGWGCFKLQFRFLDAMREEGRFVEMGSFDIDFFLPLLVSQAPLTGLLIWAMFWN